jgi:hypothetical protein
MVLFHAAFGALKARCPMTINLTMDDLVLAGETRRFQGCQIFLISWLHSVAPCNHADTIFFRKIVDDDFEHILTVLQDKKSGGLRLHAAVRNGELRRCPVWTAFGKINSSNLLTTTLSFPTDFIPSLMSVFTTGELFLLQKLNSHC